MSEPLTDALPRQKLICCATRASRLSVKLAAWGAQMAVCALELLPEARKCGHDLRLGQGAALGAVVMGWTLYVGI